MMALRDEAGAAIGFLKILRDRTEQRDAAASLQASEAFLRSVLDSSADCIKVLDLDARLGFMNEGGRRVMEVDDFDGVGREGVDGFWEGAGQGEARAAVEDGAGRRHRSFRRAGLHPEGRPKWWDVQVTPIRDGEGAVDEAARRLARRDGQPEDRGPPCGPARRTSARSWRPCRSASSSPRPDPAASSAATRGSRRSSATPCCRSPAVVAYGEWRAVHADGSPVEAVEYPVAR